MIDHQAIIDRISAVPLHKGRRVVAIAGAPASGKSTLAGALQKQIPNSCVLPMDGFHRSNEDLKEHRLLARKGAPETFDVAGFEAIIHTVRARKEVDFPTFDRGNDCVVPGGGAVKASDETILVEGNYLLLDVAPWNALAGLWDFSIMLEVPIEELKARLVDRWLAHGFDRKGAIKRAEENDLRNARTMIKSSFPADMTVSQS